MWSSLFTAGRKPLCHYYVSALKNDREGASRARTASVGWLSHQSWEQRVPTIHLVWDSFVKGATMFMEISEGNSLSTILLLPHFFKDVGRHGCTWALNCKIRDKHRSRPSPVLLSDSHFLLGFRLAQFTDSMKSTIVTIDGSADGQQFGSFGNLKSVTLCRVKPSSAYGTELKI